MDIEVDAKGKQNTAMAKTAFPLSSGGGLGEPEPEIIKSSDDEGSGRLSNFKA